MFEWFTDSLARLDNSSEVRIIAVDLFASTRNITRYKGPWTPTSKGEVMDAKIVVTSPKPNVWQGTHRLTKENWWAISNARNTATCLCKTEWIAFCDDRCVLAPTWLQGVRDAMEGDYAVAGSYEKRSGMKVENGAITDHGVLIGTDFRNPDRMIKQPYKTYGGDWYGCTSAAPMEWVLEQNGHAELCDSLGLEDVVFGNMLMLNNHITVFDSKMKIIEDRTPEHCKDMPKRTDKGLSPHDRSHALLDRLAGRKRCDDQIDLRAERERVLRGEPWTIPTGPVADWYDGQPLGEMTVR